jgi:hypothetical protein
MSNIYANKPFLNAQMVAVLATSFTQDASVGASDASFNVTQTGTTLTVAGLTNSPIKLGSLIAINGSSSVMVVSFGTGGTGGNGDYNVDLSQTVSSTTARISAYTVTVQDALNTFLTNPSASQANYCKLIASSTAAVNAINGANPTTAASGKNGLRLFLATDDGTPIMDTGKCTFPSTLNSTNQFTSLVSTPSNTSGVLGNTWVNYKNKILITSAEYSSNNVATFLDTGNVGNTVYTVIGTAGGNGINENHNTRPEFLAALLKDSGIAFSNRYSSSTATTNYYMAQRFGVSLEANAGTIRLNVPIVEAS